MEAGVAMVLETVTATVTVALVMGVAWMDLVPMAAVSLAAARQGQDKFQPSRYHDRSLRRSTVKQVRVAALVGVGVVEAVVAEVAGVRAQREVEVMAVVAAMVAVEVEARVRVTAWVAAVLELVVREREEVVKAREVEG